MTIALTQASVHYYNPKALVKKWEQMHVTVWNGMLGMGAASHKRAVARCIQGPRGKDIGRKSFSLSLSRTRIVKEDPRCSFPHHADNVLAVTVINKDSSETVRCRWRHVLYRLHGTTALFSTSSLAVFPSGAPIFIREPTFPGLICQDTSSVWCNCAVGSALVHFESVKEFPA